MKLTRRELAITAAGAAAIAVQAESAAQTAPGDDLIKTVRATNARNSETLAKFEIPMATEPAFQFKA